MSKDTKSFLATLPESLRPTFREWIEDPEDLTARLEKGEDGIEYLVVSDATWEKVLKGEADSIRCVASRGKPRSVKARPAELRRQLTRTLIERSKEASHMRGKSKREMEKECIDADVKVVEAEDIVEELEERLATARKESEGRWCEGAYNFGYLVGHEDGCNKASLEAHNKASDEAHKELTSAEA